MAQANAPLTANPGEHLTIDRMLQYAPTIGAVVPHHECSARYRQTSTLDTINTLAALGYGVTSVQTTHPRKKDKIGFQKHLLRFAPLSYSPGLDRTEIISINSHDRTTADELMLGIFRMACANGIIAGRSFESEKIFHTGAAQSKLDAAIQNITRRFGELESVADSWKSIELESGEYSEFVDRAMQLRLGARESDDKTAPGAWSVNTNQFSAQRESDMGRDLWSAFNRVQERVTRGGFTVGTVRPDGRIAHRRARAAGAIDSTIHLNRGVWDIAESFAARKIAA
jgi:hypothetical protein